jgi:integrase
MNILDPISPQDALDWYTEHREDELRAATIRKYESALSTSVDWTDRVDIDDMNDVKGRQLMQFQTWRKQEADLATVSLNGNLAILQRFLRFCENIDAIPEGLTERVPMPNVPEQEEVNYEVPSDEEVEGIKSYFHQFERASRRHVEFELIAEVGMRLGAVRAMDLEDFDPEEKTIYIRDRPEGPN